MRLQGIEAFCGPERQVERLGGKNDGGGRWRRSKGDLRKACLAEPVAVIRLPPCGAFLRRDEHVGRKCRDQRVALTIVTEDKVTDDQCTLGTKCMTKLTK